MIRISKVNAFELVSILITIGNEEMANKILHIISRSIKKDNNNKGFSPYIDIKDKNEIRIIKKLYEEYFDTPLNYIDD